MNFNFMLNQHLYMLIPNQVFNMRYLTIKINVKMKGYSNLLLLYFRY